MRNVARALSLLLFLLFVVGTVPPGSGQQALPVLAVSDFSGDDPALCQAVTEIVLTDLAKSRRLTLVERAQLRQAMNESRFQKTGLAATGDVASAGRLIGATHLVVGSVNLNDERVILNARVLDVRTGALHAGVAENTEGWRDELFALAHELANRLHHRLTGESLPGFVEPTSEPSGSGTVPRVSPPLSTPDWENLPESGAIAHALAKGWMRLFADGSFRPHETVSEWYFYETVRRLARRYGLDATPYYPVGDGSGRISRLAAVRALQSLVNEAPSYFLDVPPWAISWLDNAPHKLLSRARFASLLQRVEEQLQRKITRPPSVSSESVRER